MTTNSSVAIADVYAALEAVPQRHLENASFLMHLKVLNKVRQLGDDSLGNFTVDLTAEGVPQILGKPVYVASDMSGDLNTSTNNSMVVGSVSEALTIYDRSPIRVEVLPMLYAKRTTGPVDSEGFAARSAAVRA